MTHDHAGVLLAAATLLKTQAPLTWSQQQRVRTTFERISRRHGVTWRDPRIALLQALPPNEPRHESWYRRWLDDPDPEVARLAALRASETGALIRPFTLRYIPDAFPGEARLREFEGATATVRIRGRGTITLRLDLEEAPMAVYTFAMLAYEGAYVERTIHRIVPNFVVQGGSPGADEYDPATIAFMRDEVGGRNVRGSWGISTRGRDTGDGQFYINLVNNVRLDGDYTVFAQTIKGMDVVDRIQEGDVIESVTIHKANGG